MSIPDKAVEVAIAADREAFAGRATPKECIRAALAAALPYLTEDYEHHLRDLAMAREEAADAAERIAELEEFVKDSECTCLPYANLYDGMCQRCLFLHEDGDA